MENQDGFHVPPEFAAELLRMLLEQEQATARPSWLTARIHGLCRWLDDRAPGDRGWWLLRELISRGFVGWLFEFAWKFSARGAAYGVMVVDRRDNLTT